MGEEVRKLIGKAILAQSAPAVIKYFAPFQLGLAKGGCELVNLAIRCLLVALPNAPVAAIDVSNAYNAVFRASTFAALNGASDEFRELLPFWHSMYATGRPLLFRAADAPVGFVYIDSEEGTAQGDPFSGFAFNFTIHPVLLRLFGPRGNFNGLVFAVAYADDITLVALQGCPLATFNLALATLCEELATTGNFVNVKKTVVCTLGMPLFGPGLHPPPRLPTPDGWVDAALNTVGWVCLGAPIYAPTPAGHAFARAHYTGCMDRAVVKFNATITILRHDTQRLFKLLQACVSPTYNHITRCCPIDALLLSSCHAFDDFIFASLASVLQLDLHSMTPAECIATRIQVSLPLSCGGFGLRSIVRAAPCATISSINTHADAIRTLFASARLGPQYEPLLLLARHITWAQHVIVSSHAAYEPALFASKCQREIAHALELLTLRGLMDAFVAAGALADAARLVSLTGVTCAATYGWLIVFPGTALHSFTSAEFRIASLLRLGLAPSLCPNVPKVTRCGGTTCSANLDRAWHHFFSCPCGARKRLHDNINLYFGEEIASGCAKLSVHIEERGTVTGKKSKPGDSILRGEMPWRVPPSGVALFCDFNVPHTCLPTYTGRNSWRDVCAAVLINEKDKISKFNSVHTAGIMEHHAFEPLVIDTYGCIGRRLRVVLEGLATLSVRKRPGFLATDVKGLETASKAQVKSFLIDMSCTLQHQLALFISTRAAASS
jgi:hypothetical protein